MFYANPFGKLRVKPQELLYIGKAANIRERVKNHFNQPSYRDIFFKDQVKRIGYIITDSEIQALLLEAKLIKELSPKFNVNWKDDKNYFYVQITGEPRPRVLITHQAKDRGSKYIGPFVDGNSLKKTLRLLRRPFPYYTSSKHPAKKCQWCQIGLCPGPEPDKKQYQKNLSRLTEVLKGGRKSALKNMEREMREASKSQDFEKAALLRDKIGALEKVIFHARVFENQTLKENWPSVSKTLGQIVGQKERILRLEGYDISNIQGQAATGSMVVFSEGIPDKNLYRKFKISISGKPNDTAMIKEMLLRRLWHKEWPLPEIMLIDGGKGQLNSALRAKQEIPKAEKIRIISLAKRENRLFVEGKNGSLMLKALPREISNLILQIRDESHRFAVSYHKNLRKKEILGENT